jgi:hypothetical protein
MVRADLTVVCSDRWLSPIAPAQIGGGKRWRSRRLVRSSEEPIGLAERMLWNPRVL